jgi:hypothetical protein
MKLLQRELRPLTGRIGAMLLSHETNVDCGHFVQAAFPYQALVSCQCDPSRAPRHRGSCIRVSGVQDMAPDGRPLPSVPVGALPWPSFFGSPGRVAFRGPPNRRPVTCAASIVRPDGSFHLLHCFAFAGSVHPRWDLPLSLLMTPHEHRAAQSESFKRSKGDGWQ